MLLDPRQVGSEQLVVLRRLRRLPGLIREDRLGKWWQRRPVQVAGGLSEGANPADLLLAALEAARDLVHPLARDQILDDFAIHETTPLLLRQSHASLPRNCR